ncbi:hypothetical protein NDU88_003791 [Pleurodeles waltl]|uniref:Uncharacterized protein n=1 Tax=Pleurodeles waltl TaxID=8319 RepID=A0AAV7UD51_PLEWA|nr:hypothetical protein NDU88_003791 [Pleurodeles waltl]
MELGCSPARPGGRSARVLPEWDSAPKTLKLSPGAVVLLETRAALSEKTRRLGPVEGRESPGGRDIVCFQAAAEAEMELGCSPARPGAAA